VGGIEWVGEIDCISVCDAVKWYALILSCSERLGTTIWQRSLTVLACTYEFVEGQCSLGVIAVSCSACTSAAAAALVSGVCINNSWRSDNVLTLGTCL